MDGHLRFESTMLIDNFRNTQELVNLVKESRQTLSSFAKAKSSKLGMFPYLLRVLNILS
jgi:hypothetical protein